MKLCFIIIPVARWLVLVQQVRIFPAAMGIVVAAATVSYADGGIVKKGQPKHRQQRRLGDHAGDGVKEKENQSGEASPVIIAQGPSDCCEPPKNLPPDVIAQLQDAETVGVGVDIPKDAIESGKNHKSDPAPLDSLVITVDVTAAADQAAPAILESFGINITDTSMEGGGFNPVITTVTSQVTEGSAFSFTIPSNGDGEIVPPQSMIMDTPVVWDFFPRTGIEESELIEYPVDEQLLVFEDEGSLTTGETTGEDKEELLAVAKVNIFSTKEESDARKLNRGGIVNDIRQHHDRRHLQVSQGINTAPIGLFNPLACNANIATADCSANKLSSLLSGSAAVTVPCGKCYTYDLSTSTPIAIGGLDIRGKLYIPPNYKEMADICFIQLKWALHRIVLMDK